ncbi:MAG: hypothetical protein ACXACB_05020 [Promethearchaeota archaeon]
MDSIIRLDHWLDEHDFKGYEPFDGLSSFLRPLTLQKCFPERVLQQLILRCPFHIRPLVGVKPMMSTKGMGFLARGYIRMWKTTRQLIWKRKATYCLDWLIDNKSRDYSGACWGNHFDYASRGGQLPKFVPTVVWTSLIGQAFLDGYEFFSDKRYLDVARSCCEFILKDLLHVKYDKGICIGYSPLDKKATIHNSNMLGAAFLARTSSLVKRKELADIAREAISYSCNCQLSSGGWYYGESDNYHWIDNWHTAYNLDSLQWYILTTGDKEYLSNLKRGYIFYRRNFFEGNGKPKYYFDKLYLVDIQCASQAIDTLCFLSKDNLDGISLAIKVATWTIDNMQDKSGYFYYRKLRRKIVKVPMLHWGQATMFSALSHLYSKLSMAE